MSLLLSITGWRYGQHADQTNCWHYAKRDNQHTEWELVAKLKWFWQEVQLDKESIRKCRRKKSKRDKFYLLQRGPQNRLQKSKRKKMEFSLELYGKDDSS